MVENNTPPSHLSDAFDALFASANSFASGVSAPVQPPRSGGLDNRAATLTPKVKEAVQISRWRLKHTVSNILRSVDSETTPGVCKCGTAGHNSELISLTRDGKKLA